MSKRSFGFERLAEQAAEKIYAEARYSETFARGDSPIEQLFWASIVMHFRIADGGVYELAAEPTTDKRYFAFMQRQVEIAGARVDFLFSFIGYEDAGLIVECDGHDFHERTKEQAAKDRSRDRAFQEKGYTVFRFTGSEIWRDPMGCAEQVGDWLLKKHISLVMGEK